MKVKSSSDQRYFYLDYVRTSIDANIRLDRLAIPKQRGKSFLKKILQAARFPSLLLRICFFPKGATCFFNHSKRVRRGPQGPTSLYLERILRACGPAVVIEEFRSTTKFPDTAHVIDWEPMEQAARLLAKFFPRGEDPERALFSWETKLAGLVLRILRPTKIIYLVWYSRLWVAAAAKQLGIPAIELQHGAIYPENTYYRFNHGDGVNFSNSNYLLPDEIWTYGEYWKQILVDNGFPKNRIQPVGYYLDDTPKVALDFDYLLYVSNAETPLELTELLGNAAPELRRRGWKVVIAPHPHPVENSGVHFDALKATYEFVMTLPYDSYDLVQNAKVVVGIGSSMLWECIQMKKPVYFLECKYERLDSWGDFLRSGYVKTLAVDQFPEPFALPPDGHVRESFFSKFASMPN